MFGHQGHYRSGAADPGSVGLLLDKFTVTAPLSLSLSLMASTHFSKLLQREEREREIR